MTKIKSIPFFHLGNPTVKLLGEIDYVENGQLISEMYYQYKKQIYLHYIIFSIFDVELKPAKYYLIDDISEIKTNFKPDKKEDIKFFNYELPELKFERIHDKNLGVVLESKDEKYGSLLFNTEMFDFKYWLNNTDLPDFRKQVDSIDTFITKLNI